MSILSLRGGGRSDNTSNGDVVTWAQVGDCLWLGKVDLEYVGMIELVGDRYEVLDRNNERVSSAASLEAAQLLLDPYPRVAARRPSDNASDRHVWIANATIGFSLVVAVVATTEWMFFTHH